MKKATSIILEEKDIIALDNFAVREERTRSQIIRLIVKNFLEEIKKDGRN